jgi:hypothetical protein
MAQYHSIPIVPQQANDITIAANFMLLNLALLVAGELVNCCTLHSVKLAYPDRTLIFEITF